MDSRGEEEIDESWTGVVAEEMIYKVWPAIKWPVTQGSSYCAIQSGAIGPLLARIIRTLQAQRVAKHRSNIANATTGPPADGLQKIIRTVILQ